MQYCVRDFYKSLHRNQNILMNKSLITLATFALFSFSAMGQDGIDWKSIKIKNDSSDQSYYYQIETKGGNIVVGEIIKITSTSISILANELGVLDFELANIKRINLYDATNPIGTQRRKMVGVNHYLIAPSSPYSLDKGEINFQNSEIFIVSGWYGVTKNFTIGAGMSIVPGIPFSDQLYFITPKLSAELAPKITASIQYAQVFAPGISNTSLLSGSIGFGRSDKNFSIGYSTPLSVDGDGTAFEAALLTFGSVFRVGNKFALLMDINIPTFDSDFGLIGFGGRFIGHTSSFDFGFVSFAGQETGFPFPWFNYTLRL